MSNERYLHLIRQDCPLPPGTHVVIYCRDSGGDEQDRSVLQQIEAAQEYCAHFGLVEEHTYFDEAVKATAVEKRDEFTAMMTDLRKRFPAIYDPVKRVQKAKDKPFGVLCWKSNRLGRDLIHTRHIKSDLRLRGIHIVSLVPIFESGDPGMDAIIESFYEYQDEQLLREISENSRRGLAQLVTLRDTDPTFLAYNPDWEPTGAYLSIMPGGVPRGFKAERITVGTYKRKTGTELRVVQRIVPDPERWERCRLAWEMRREGASIRDIMDATRLYKNVSGYASFFKNLIYTGTLEYGGKRIEQFVPALIPMEWWVEEQARRTERGKKTRGEAMKPEHEPRRVGAKHLLSGLLYCGSVAGEEHPMLADCIPAKEGVRGHWDFYICNTKKNSRGHKCPSRRMGARALESSVIDCIMQDILTRENLRPLADAIAQQLQQTNNDANVRLSAVRDELAQVERQVENLLGAIEDMGLSPSLKDKLTKREAEKEKLKGEVALLEQMMVKSPNIPLITNAMLDEWIAHIGAALRSDNTELANRTLRQFVSKIVLEDGEGDIYYTFPVPAEAQERIHLGKGNMDVRGAVPNTRHTLLFDVPVPPSTATHLAHFDKEQLRAEIMVLHTEGLSYRAIGEVLGLHWTRIGQLMKET